jgi:hypothetical protein
MAITQGEAEAWVKKIGATAESRETDQGWAATVRFGEQTTSGEAPDEAEARYIAIVKLRKIIAKTNPVLAR